MSPRPANFSQRLAALSPQMLRSLRRGVEKESLRVRPNGMLAATPHPPALGSALTHPHITTDFSEALIELITGVHLTPEECIAELTRIHQVVYRNIGDELLWNASMPCMLPAEKDIPIAQYGSSNVGRAKTVYRLGLSHRYGRRMQTIAGLHYNFSMPDAAWPALLDQASKHNATPSDGYFAMIRNFRRHGWLPMVLFGASPAVCQSFVQGRPHRLIELGKSGTMYLPHATSLRMGRLGYQSEAQDNLAVSYNCLDSYTDSLHDALTHPHPPYESIGIRSGLGTGDGPETYRQLATTLLQIENEFYSTIRPKRVIRAGERPLHALRERGVEYLEVRAMDLDPYSPVGITAPVMRFLDVFLLHCLLTDSPQDTPQEIETLNRNKLKAASQGREPGLKLQRGTEHVELRAWATELLAECAPIAAALDDAHGGSAHRDVLTAATTAMANMDTLPSARMLREIERSHNESYTSFAMSNSVAHQQALKALPLDPKVEAQFAQWAKDSIAEQAAIEAADTTPFETFRQQYLAPESLTP